MDGCIACNTLTKPQRFIKVDRKDLLDDLTKQEKSLLEDLVALEKKQAFMKKEVANAQGNLRDVFQSRN